MSKLGFFSDPHVQYVSQVIEEVLAGNLQIPQFQRPYIWDWDRRLNLLRSVQLGIPMGAIMIWRTSEQSLKTFSNFGTIRFKQPQPSGPRQYLLDGVQRLSTLVSALTAPGDALQEIDPSSPYVVEEEERSAYFDLEANDFVSIKPGQISAKHMPLHVLSSSLELLRFQRKLVGPDVDRWLALSDALARAFREYKIPVIPIVTDDIGLASQTFQRINSAGKQMSEKHMLHALTYTTSFDLTAEIENLRSSLDNIGWSSIDDELLLRLMKAALQLDVYKASVDDVSRSIKQNPDLFPDLRKAIVKAAEFFRLELSMPNPDFVPYAVQVIGIVEAFRIADKEPVNIPVDKLRDWVWLTTYLEYFTGLSGDKVIAQLNFVRNGVRQQNFDLEKAGLPLLEQEVQKPRFDYRSARSRAWMVTLATISDHAVTGTGSDLIRRFGRTAIVPGLPREVFSNPDSYFSPGNRFLVAPTELDAFRNALMTVRDEEFLGRHGIGREVLFLKDGDFDAFVVLRQDRITTWEYERLSKLAYLIPF